MRDGGCFRHFQKGSIHASPRGVFPVAAGIAASRGSSGWESGLLGYPVSNYERFRSQGYCEQRFEGGTIAGQKADGPPSWAPATSGGTTCTE
ncbi:hypothetical protein HJ590_03975 [Naumannella sp. ID2617S]|nr:hypothetical protein [Naumannella sp. ID2617S]